MLLRERRGHAARFFLRARHRLPRRQAADRPQHVIATSRARMRDQWNPAVGLFGKVEAGGHHADDLVRCAVDRHLLPDHAAIAAEAALPRAV
jgi:hypothetical protein